jgi:hypothetical protein
MDTLQKAGEPVARELPHPQLSLRPPLQPLPFYNTSVTLRYLWSPKSLATCSFTPAASLRCPGSGSTQAQGYVRRWGSEGSRSPIIVFQERWDTQSSFLPSSMSLPNASPVPKALSVPAAFTVQFSVLIDVRSAFPVHKALPAPTAFPVRYAFHGLSVVLVDYATQSQYAM